MNQTSVAHIFKILICSSVFFVSEGSCYYISYGILNIIIQFLKRCCFRNNRENPSCLSLPFIPYPPRSAFPQRTFCLFLRKLILKSSPALSTRQPLPSNLSSTAKKGISPRPRRPSPSGSRAGPSARMKKGRPSRTSNSFRPSSISTKSNCLI